MTALIPQTTEILYLKPNSFKFKIKKIPNTELYIQKIQIPGITLGESDYPAPHIKVVFPGNTLTYQQLPFTFKVDEQLDNWFELYNWMFDLGGSYASANNVYKMPHALQVQMDATGKGATSEATLVMLDSQNQTTRNIVFQNCFPVQLSPLQLANDITGIDYVTATCTLAYQLYTVQPKT